MSEVQAVPTGQGTRLNEKAPWESYAAEMDMKMSKELAAAVAEYAERRYEDNESSNQSKEELHRQQEINGEISKEYQWIKPQEYADHGARIGKVMTHAEFITALRKAHQGTGEYCWYTQHPQPQKAVLYWKRFGNSDPEIACWVQQGQMPELSIMRFDEHGVPLDEQRRGWRTCLLQLILKGFISEQKAIKIFGHPKQTEAFARYNRTLQEFRNAGNSLGE